MRAAPFARMRVRRASLVVILLAVAQGAGAEPARATRRANPEPTQAVYAELFGKGGLWGLGYDHRLGSQLSIGAVASFYSLDGQRVLSFSPYLGFRIARSGPHAWFADLGPNAVHTWTPSPVPEWDGDATTGIGGGLSSGYEYRARIVIRAFAHGAFGKGGVLPWFGGGVGWAF